MKLQSLSPTVFFRTTLTRAITRQTPIPHITIRIRPVINTGLVENCSKFYLNPGSNRFTPKGPITLRISARAEISSLRLHEARAEIFSSVSQTGLEISAWAEIRKNLTKSHSNFNPRLKSVLGHARSPLIVFSTKPSKWRSRGSSGIKGDKIRRKSYSVLG